MQVYLAQPRGFCAGVTRAITIVERALAVYGPPVYVRHEIVHNRTVVKDLRQRGAIFIEQLDQVPDGATLIFSAHGVSQAVENEAIRRGFHLFDATCPLVTKVHKEVVRMHQAGKTIIMIGHEGHPEVQGTMGQLTSGITLIENLRDIEQLPAAFRSHQLSYVTQTTISTDDARVLIDSLKQRFPQIQEPKKADICYATQNRQDAVKALSETVQLVLVIGSQTSSNSNRLQEISARNGLRSYLIDSADDLNWDWFKGIERVGITAGASAPEELVQQVLCRLEQHYGAQFCGVVGGISETLEFPMPKGLWASDLPAPS